MLGRSEISPVNGAGQRPTALSSSIAEATTGPSLPVSAERSVERTTVDNARRFHAIFRPRGACVGERIAVIEQYRSTRDLLTDILGATGYEVAAFDNAWAAAADGDFRLVVTDTVGAVYDAAANESLVRRLRATFKCPVLVLTAHSAAKRDEARLGCDVVVVRPFDLNGFVRTVRALVGSPERRRLPRAS
jgi:CheY-like chemotaxis protein